MEKGTVLILGGHSNIGLAIAHRFIGRPCHHRPTGIRGYPHDRGYGPTGTIDGTARSSHRSRGASSTQAAECHPCESYLGTRDAGGQEDSRGDLQALEAVTSLCQGSGSSKKSKSSFGAEKFHLLEFSLTPSRNVISTWLHFQSVTRLKMAVRPCTARTPYNSGDRKVLLSGTNPVLVHTRTPPTDPLAAIAPFPCGRRVGERGSKGGVPALWRGLERLGMAI